ncbi:guanosine monophosphate reductase [Patescibacteria group bacterium]|nr:guanosine monophosphate reductase [Patescibacteria group bacterium]MBU1256713.1 guanosine monophosphate reductase [Patescibacteria group bacterium]MBU1457436.1 guanosine monophosphate reductase [Patescibacteria group bacterium]
MREIKLALSYDDVLLVPKRSKINSRGEVDLGWGVGKMKFSLPIIAINMDAVTGVEMAIAMGKLGGLAILPRFDKSKIQAEKIVKIKKAGVAAAGAIGVTAGEWERLEMMVKAGVDHVSIDVAHGQMDKVLQLVKKIRKTYPGLSLSAGVVGTYRGAKDLFLAGVDVVRVGVGPGTICTTRIMTGCGVPQITAVMEASRAAREMKKMVWADGGTKNSGDIVKGLAAGASAVIVGSQLAGTDEASGKMRIVSGKQYKEYNASTSFTEKKNQLKNNGGGKSKYYVKHIEGVESLVPYKGAVEGVVSRLMAGVRSGFSYCGARNIGELWEKREFIRITGAGMREGGAHDVIV